MSNMSRPMTLVVAALALAGAAQAHEIVFTAALSGPAESPSNTSPGTGFATVTLDLDLITMHVVVDFEGLLGNTTASHIHGPTAIPLQGTASVMTALPTFPGFPLGVTAGHYDATFDLTLASSYNTSFINNSGGTISGALNRLISSMENGQTYLNIHTSSFGGGEIRGFLVPAPGAAAMLGMAGLFASRRRRA